MKNFIITNFHAQKKKLIVMSHTRTHLADGLGLR